MVTAQKKYVADHLTKSLVRNHGVLPMYYAEGTHTPLVDPKVFEAARNIMEARREHRNVKGKATNRYPFSGMILCTGCGKTYKRVTTHGRVAWNCSTYLKFGKDACHAKQIPEPILLSLAAQALRLSAFDEAAFDEQIQEIRIPAHDRVVFVFRDGHTAECVWQNQSRRDS